MKMTSESMADRFKHHPPRGGTGDEDRHESVREAVHRAAEELRYLLPESREASLAVTKLEEAMFWANAALARNRD